MEEPIPENEIPVLDHGFVRLVDQMGDDSAIVQAARVSYGKGTTKVSQDKALIRYLLRHRHTTPFEMVELKWHAKMPIFVARQWVRHRTANINEYSLRYSEAPDEFYIPKPENVRLQSITNRQGGSDEKISPEIVDKTIKYMKEISTLAMKRYKELNGVSVARELTRSLLPVNLYTQWYWKNDLHNTFNFLKLRMDKHAQFEIREYANAMASIVKEKVPIAYQAFEDYILNAMSFSKLEQQALSGKLPKRFARDLQEDLIYKIARSIARNKKIDSIEWLHEIYLKEGGQDNFSGFKYKIRLGKETGNIFETRESRDKLKLLIKND